MKYRWLLFIFVAALSVPLILGLQSILVLLPAPFNNISLPVIALSLGLLIWKSGVIVWYAAALFAMLDWYTATPYGLVLYAGTLAMLVVIWLYRAVITNQGVLAAALVAFTITSFFQLFYALGRAGLSLVTDTVVFPGAAWLSTYVAQVLITVPVTVLLYVVLARLIPVLKVTHTHRSTLYG